MRTEDLIMRIEELKHPEKNVRRHSRKQIEEMKRSLDAFEQYRPILVDENNTILCGNGLVTAMREMGREEAKVTKYYDLTSNQKKKLMIADNQISSLGTDDMEVIEEFIKSLGSDLDVPGYDKETLEMLVAESAEVTEQVMSYGVYTPDEVESVKRYEEAPIQPVKQTFQPPIERVGSPAPIPAEERTSATAEREQWVICPHCGEKIWLE